MIRVFFYLPGPGQEPDVNRLMFRCEWIEGRGEKWIQFATIMNGRRQAIQPREVQLGR